MRLQFTQVWRTKFFGKHLLEAPVYCPTKKRLLFTDLFQGIVYSFDPSHPTNPPVILHSYGSLKPNGMQLLSPGRLAVCLWEGSPLDPLGTVHELDINVSPIVSSQRVMHSNSGERFHHPNDIAVDENQGIYFTDLRAGFVYYHAPQDKSAKPCLQVANPNGIELEFTSNTATSLFVAESGRAVESYKINGPGKLGKETGCFPFKKGRAIDGIAFGPDRRLFVAEEKDVYVLDRELTKVIARKPLCHRRSVPSNICFVDANTFFVTSYRSYITWARASLYLGKIVN